MRGAPVVLAVAVIAALGVAAFLYVASFPACGCQPWPAPSVMLSRVDDARTDGWRFEVQGVTPGLTYGDVSLWHADSPLTMVVGRAPARGEWSAQWGEMSLGPENAIMAGDVVEGWDAGEIPVLHHESNSVVALVVARVDAHLE